MTITNNEAKEFFMLAMIGDILGTAWWSALCFCGGAVFGIWFYPTIRDKFSR